ncbi:GSCFA domain-containing protein [Robertkochia flava]|uniref:GSCFA domain-containing protein n=1 Tax=Robertkochia flava TaxID=3447986 RepID=UPI001CCC0E75|nr:GSCFA domain-containing protein [Robertkochia marina]
MKFQTPVPVNKQYPEIGYDSSVVLLGSCFVEHMGDKLGYYNFRSCTNPFGVLFNPYAIANLVERAVAQRGFIPDDTFYADERWNSFEVHSQCSRAQQEVFLDILNTGLSQLHEALHAASHLVITLGTAWVYRHVETNRVVANCHKVPQKAFVKELLDVQEIRLQLERIEHLVRGINTGCRVIVTVSPVRHIKDGVTENQRSKAHLIAALHDFLEDTSDWVYFPSYEILMDELRDYRFYADDMLHPSEMAVEVVWDRFVGSWMSSETLEVMKRVGGIRKGLAHRPFNPEGKAHLAFREKLRLEIQDLTSRYPHMQFPDFP